MNGGAQNHLLFLSLGKKKEKTFSKVRKGALMFPKSLKVLDCFLNLDRSQNIFEKLSKYLRESYFKKGIKCGPVYSFFFCQNIKLN